MESEDIIYEWKWSEVSEWMIYLSSKALIKQHSNGPHVDFRIIIACLHKIRSDFRRHVEEGAGYIAQLGILHIVQGSSNS